MKKRLPLLFLLSLIISSISCMYQPTYKENDSAKPIVDPNINPNWNPNIIQETKVPTEKKNVNTLVLLYMDADNSLHNDILEDRNEVQAGLNLLKENDDVEVIVLWDSNSDGEVQKAKLPEGDEAKYSIIKKGFGDSRLFRLERNNRIVDLSSTVDWMPKYEFKGETLYEVSMSNPKTMEDFLSWAKSRYNWNNLILHLSNHGGGPGSARSISSRIVCEDLNKVSKEDSRYLGTKDVPNAIRNAGISKASLMIQDVCYGGTIEEIYEYNGLVDYMLLSPNLMANKGLNYKSLISHLTEGDCIINGKFDGKKYLKSVACDFIDDYKSPNGTWKNQISCLRQEYNDEILETITGVNMASINDLVKSINKLSKLLIENENRDLKIDNSNDTFKLMSVLRNTLEGTLNYGPATRISSMYDIGFLMNELWEVASINQWTEMQNAIEEVRKYLDNSIISSWRDGYNGAMYSKNTKSNLVGFAPYNVGTYGITICGYEYILKLDTGYSDELAFAKNPEYDFPYGQSAASEWVKLMNKVYYAERIRR